ncbi:conserved exported hypothetical protein [Candidatus Desulfosporosinus infrequens]|uniref:Uncharacterized protein n=1 Tax=Candidatus Desulfosporosinus infrequens TaxID=2043169 RepID=A0A2U3L109_9FIRM|nr:conserved exported hypothetical protein [Candidatus Desulfosporosinus infrequens]
MSLNKRIGIGILIIALSIGGAFFVERMAIVQGQQAGKMIPVVQNNKTIAYLDAGVIKQLGEQERGQTQGKSNPNGDNEVSLSYVLGSAGINKFQYVDVNGVGDDEDYKLGPKEIADLALSANDNNTVAMVKKVNGNHVMIAVVGKLSIN